MMSAGLEAYLAELRRELWKRGVIGRRIIEEARAHLIDAIHAGLLRGISAEAAESEAFARFGTPQEAAAHFAEESSCMSNRLFFMLARAARANRREEGRVAHYRELRSRYHFANRLMRPYQEQLMRTLAGARKEFLRKFGFGRGICILETDHHDRMDQFLREFGLRTFGAGGTLESLTLLGDTACAGQREGRYLAAFGTGAKMIWTVVVSSDGGVSIDGTYASA